MTGIAPLLDQVFLPQDLRTLDEGQLRHLADELRAEVIDAVSVTGGHLGAGLGVVELTVALHYVFDTPKDRIIWDVGHQAYPHKILTGRRDRIRTLRVGGGLSGFTKRSESPYDPFGAAHSSTSISAGLGMAVARDLAGADNHVVCVIGDGAMSAGMAYEAMNNAGALKSRLIVVINDNDMSIAPPVGAMSAYLSRLAARQPSAPKRGIGSRTLFEDMGFEYIGPIDGHDLAQLLPVLKSARAAGGGPILVHVLTEKGKGYPPAEASPDRYHGVLKFDVATGKQDKAISHAPSYTKILGQSLIREASADSRIVAITAAMPSGTGIDLFGQAFPDRTFDVGIAEQHAVTFAAGLATEGFKPFCAIYSTFLQRAFDQVVHDVAIQCLPVRFVVDRAGLVGADGPTHAGSFDLAYLGCLPNFVIMAPSDEAELVDMVATQVAINDRPSALRFPRGEGTGASLPAHGVALAIGRGRIVKQGTKVALLSLGTRLAQALEAALELEALGHSTTVADARFAKPLDRDMILSLARDHEILVTVEEGSVGGFGSFVLHLLAEEGMLDGALKIRQMVLPDSFVDHDTPERMYRQAGLDSAAIVSKVISALRPARVPEWQLPGKTMAHSSDLFEPAKTVPAPEKSLKVILAQPRGFCAGVVRAVEIVELALAKHGEPVYVRHEIVHNQHVVASLKAKGARFVDNVSDIPDGAVTIFSAHGVAKSIENEALARNLPVIDATCPLVAKVHKEGKRYVALGRTLILIGHAGHPEVEGTMGQVAGKVLLVQTEADVAALDLPASTPLSYVTQTTLSVDDTKGIIAALHARFADVTGPSTNDICYATQNRQSSVRDLAKVCDLILVVGANNSSNSKRLREIGEEVGKPSYLIADASQVDPAWLHMSMTIGLTAGASAPEVLVRDVIARLRDFGQVEVSTYPGVEETIEFPLPAVLRDVKQQAMAAAS